MKYGKNYSGGENLFEAKSFFGLLIVSNDGYEQSQASSLMPPDSLISNEHAIFCPYTIRQSPRPSFI
jgi:hypothetical protein